VDESEKVYQVQEVVYVGTMYGAEDFELLKSLGISVIINTTYNPNDPTRQPSDAAIMNHFADRGITYINYDLRDHMGETFIGPVMRAAGSVLDQCQQEGRKVMVHCSGGLSRSPTIVVAWLMKNGMSLAEAVGRVTEARGRQLQPNPSFWSALTKYERELTGNLDAPPSLDFTAWVAEDLHKMGFTTEQVSRALVKHNWDADNAFHALVSKCDWSPRLTDKTVQSGGARDGMHRLKKPVSGFSMRNK